MTNIEKLCEIFPHIKTSCVKAMKICPAVMYGYVVCPFREKITDENIEKMDLKNVYDPTDKNAYYVRGCFGRANMMVLKE